MNCFMFPGQPLARGGAGGDDADYVEIAELAKARTGLDLASFAWQGGACPESVKLQIYGVAMSLYRLRCLRREGRRPDIVAEHSMGIYSALTACGSLPEGEVLEMVFRAGCCMAQLGETALYSLGCVVGLTLEPLLAIAENHGVYLANHNTSRHFLLSGARPNMEQAEAEALACGAFSAKLFPCDAPLHTPLMEEVAGKMRVIFEDYSYQEPQVPLLDHIDQDYLSKADLVDFMLRELTLPVFWERTYRTLRAAGVGMYFEVGEGDSLKKYNRWIESEIGR